MVHLKTILARWRFLQRSTLCSMLLLTILQVSHQGLVLAASELDLEYDGKLLTLEAKNVVLHHILNEIAQITDVRFVVLGSGTERVSHAKITDTLEGILRRLSPNGNFALVYADRDGNQDRISTVYFLSSSDHRAPPASAPSSASIAHDGLDAEQLLAMFQRRALDYLDAEALALLGDILINSTDIELRLVAINILARITDQTGTAIELLALAAQDGDELVKLEAVVALAGIPDETGRAIELLALAAQDENLLVKLEAVYALASIPDETGKIIEILILAAQDLDKQVRLEAIFALGGSVDPVAMDVLSQASRDDDPDVRKAVMHAATMMEPETVVMLATAALNDPDPQVKLAAVDALGNVMHLHRDVAALLMTAAENSDPLIRHRADHYLAMHGEVEQALPDDGQQIAPVH